MRNSRYGGEGAYLSRLNLDVELAHVRVRGIERDTALGPRDARQHDARLGGCARQIREPIHFKEFVFT